MAKGNKPALRRRSDQRERIREIISGSSKHPSALEIFDELRREYPRLSLGNVYRNLGILVEQEKIEALDLGHGITRYDATRVSHCHFVCRHCGRVYDLPLPGSSKIDRALQCLSPHRIESHRIQLFGVCIRCQNKPKSR